MNGASVPGASSPLPWERLGEGPELVGIATESIDPFCRAVIRSLSPAVSDTKGIKQQRKELPINFLSGWNRRNTFKQRII